MKKGIVMEVKSNTLIMMTPEGEFVKAKKQPSIDYDIGEELTFFPHLEEEKPSLLQTLKQKVKLKPVLPAAAVLLMMMFILFPSFNSSEVYAYVSVDINPSFEMSVNKDNKVMGIEPYNEEAEVLLEQMDDWKGLPLVDVTEDIIELSNENGYMDSEKNVTLTTVFTEKAEEINLL